MKIKCPYCGETVHDVEDFTLHLFHNHRQNEKTLAKLIFKIHEKIERLEEAKPYSLENDHTLFEMKSLLIK